MARPTLKEAAAITDRIIRAAARLFLSEGFDGTTMEAVAAEAGIPKTTLYKRFADKGALLHAVLAERVKSWSEIAAQRNSELTADIDQRLRHYTQLMLLWGTTKEVRSFSRLATARSVSPAEAGPYPDFFGYSEMVELIAHDIKTYGAGPALAAKSPDKVALVLMSLISGWITLRRLADPMTPQEAEADARLLVDMLCGGKAAW